MFDSQHTFQQQMPALARTFPALSYAILAISARQMERKKGVQDFFDSLELYQEAIRLLSPVLQVRDPKIVAACVLLCCLEMMSARAQDWRRHLEGCAALFDAFGIHGFSKGLLQAVFWCYARMGEFSYGIMLALNIISNDVMMARFVRSPHLGWYSDDAPAPLEMASPGVQRGRCVCIVRGS